MDHAHGVGGGVDNKRRHVVSHVKTEYPSALGGMRALDGFVESPKLDVLRDHWGQGSPAAEGDRSGPSSNHLATRTWILTGDDHRGSRVEQSRLEAEIAGLRESVQAAESTLASARRAARPTPRGFWVGLLVGGAVVATGLVCRSASSSPGSSSLCTSCRTHNLARSLAVTPARVKAATSRPWSWRRFLLGACVLPAASLLIALAVVLSK